MTNDYDSFAEAYAAETESNLLNGYDTRPAVLDLAGDMAGRRILDVGCGAGPLLAALRERGAVVTGVDSSTKMLELARQRLGDGADLRPADLRSRPLHAMTDAITEAGLRLAVISEPPPAPGARELFPDDLAKFPSGAFLCFLFFVLEAA